MKHKNRIWYLGYAFSLLIVLLMLFTDFPLEIDAGLGILFAAVFSVSHTNLLHARMMHTDKDYRIEVMDERNLAIKEKAGNVTNMITMVLLGLATVLLLLLDYVLPAVITGLIIAVQPVILIFVSHSIGKKI